MRFARNAVGARVGREADRFGPRHEVWRERGGAGRAHDAVRTVAQGERDQCQGRRLGGRYREAVLDIEHADRAERDEGECEFRQAAARKIDEHQLVHGVAADARQGAAIAGERVRRKRRHSTAARRSPRRSR